MLTREVTYPCLPVRVELGGSGADWADRWAVLALDGAYARAAIGASANAKSIDLLGLQPLAAGWRARMASDLAQLVLSGISVLADRRTDVIATARDLTVQLLDNGVVVGNNVAATTVNWPHFARGQATYGGGLAVWGWFPSNQEILDGELGLRFAVTNASGAFSCLAQLDRLQVQLTFTEPLLPAWRHAPPGFAEPRLLKPRSTPVRDLLRRPDGRMGLPVWLVEWSYVDADAGETVSVYWCDGPATGFRADTDGDGIRDRQYDAVLTQPLSMVYRLLGSPGIAGDASPSSADIIAFDPRGRHTRARRGKVEGRSVTVKLGATHLPYLSFATVATLIHAAPVEVSTSGVIRLRLQDRRALLNAAWQPLLYPASHAVAALRSTPMPLGFGDLPNVEGDWIAANKVQLMGGPPFKAITQTRVNGKATANPGTIDPINGTATFAALPAGRVTFGLQGVQDREIIIENRNATHASWVRTNCSAAQAAFGIDGVAGRSTILTATSANATCFPTVHEAPTTPVQWGYAVPSIYARLLSGTGLVELWNAGFATQLTPEWKRYFLEVANPAFPLGGVKILTNGDVVQIDYACYPPGRWYPPPPIDTTGLGVAGVSFPITWTAIVKWLLTARSGLAPFLDFDEESFARAALKHAGAMHLWYDGATTVLEALRPVLEGAGAGLYVDRLGRVVIDRAGLAERPSSLIVTERDTTREARLEDPGRKIGRVLCRWGRNHAVQTEFDPTLAEVTRELYAREWQEAEAKDGVILAEVGDTAEATAIIETALSAEADAARRAEAELELLKQRRIPMVLPMPSLDAVLMEPLDCLTASVEGITHDVGGLRAVSEAMLRQLSIDAAARRVTVHALGA